MLGGAGCHSVYRETTATLPPDPCARLKLRIEEAQAAEQREEKAAAILHDRVALGMSRDKFKPDIDRWEMTTAEFARCVAAVRDAEADCHQTAPFAAEIQRLQQHSKQLETTEPIPNAGVGSSGSRL